MFAKNKVSQSLVDAVNKIMSEKEEETKEQLLAEGWDDMLKSVKDKNKPQPSGGAGKKQGSRYGGSKQKEEPEEKEVKEEKSDEPFKPKKYTGTSKQLMQPEFKLGPKPQPKNEELKGDQHKIDANKNNKIDAQDFQLLRGRKKVKEDTFAGKLLNSLVESEEIQKEINEVMKKDATAGDWIHDFVHSKNPKFAGKSTKERQKMALGAYYAKQNEEVEDLDETRGAQAMKASGTKQSSDKLLARTGMNMAHKFPRPGQTNLGNIPGMNTPGVAKPTADYAEKRRGDRAKELKPAIKSALGTHGPKGKLPEEVELDEVKIPRSPNRRGVPVGAPSPAELAAHLASKKSEVDRHLASWKKSEHAPNDNDRATDENPQSGGDLHAIHQAAVKYMKTVKEPNPTTHSRFGSGTRFGEIAMAIANRFHQERVTKKTRLNNSFELNGFELNEVSKSEIDHHYDDWINSSGAPYNKDAGDDKKVHDSAMRHLRNKYPPIPKEKHEKLAMHMAHLYHGSGIDEAAPKKMDDVAKQNLEPAKKGVVGTVKSDFKNFKNFLAGKKETNEEVESLDEDRYLMKYLLSRGINPKYVDRNTRVGHAKSNEFKKWKADHLNSLIITRESNEMPFDGPYTKTKKNVKDKSGAVHTPMSRAKDLARSALKSVQDKTKIK